jgi:hypothetical protein
VYIVLVFEGRQKGVSTRKRPCLTLQWRPCKKGQELIPQRGVSLLGTNVVHVSYHFEE